MTDQLCNACEADYMAPGQDSPDEVGYCRTCLDELLALPDMATHLRTALDILNNLTTDEFQNGGDRPARAALVRALDSLGQATDDERYEYRRELGAHA